MKCNRSTPRVIRFREVAFTVTAMSILMLLQGCSGIGGPKATATLEQVMAKNDQSDRDIQEFNNQLFQNVQGPASMEEYILGEGDLLQISVFESQELKAEARIGSRGQITLPLIGALDVKGMTTREAEQKIEGLYRARYLHDPHVSVFVKEHMAGRVTAVGALKAPGNFPFLTRMSLFDILAQAGGLSEKAGHVVQVRRPSGDPTHPDVFIIDLDEIIKEGHAELNIEIKPGDVVYVPLAGMVYVDGAVRKPGNIPITETMTIQEAISAAGGFTLTGDQGNIKLVRNTGEGKREVVQLSLQDAKGSSIHSMKVKDRDIVFVETNTTKSLIYGLRLSLGAGLIGIGYDPRTVGGVGP